MSYQLRRAWLLVLLCAMFVLSSCGGPYEWNGSVINPPAEAPDFTLTDTEGQPWTLSQQRGKVVAMFFGFTYCPDVCPTAMSDLAKVREELGSDAENLQVVFVTVDPERDTVERMQKYVKGFDKSFIGLIGTKEELEKVYKAYGVTAIKQDMPDSALKYSVTHSGYIYVINPEGRWQLLFKPDMTVDDMVSDTRHVLQQGAA
jgi:protein SCO1/2